MSSVHKCVSLQHSALFVVHNGAEMGSSGRHFLERALHPNPVHSAVNQIEKLSRDRVATHCAEYNREYTGVKCTLRCGVSVGVRCVLKGREED